MIRARLGHGAALPFVTPQTAPGSGSTYAFLTAEDRVLIGNLYEDTQRTGGDLRQVDALAFDLGVYRSRPPGVFTDSVGTQFNQDGTPVLMELDAAEEQIAQRILTSQALSTTALPQPFLRTVLDPGLQYGGAVDFAFLEKVVYATASSGKNGERDPQAVLGPRPAERLAAMKASGQVPPPEVMRARIAAGDLTGAAVGERQDTDLLATMTAKTREKDVDLVALLLERMATVNADRRRGEATPRH